MWNNGLNKRTSKYRGVNEELEKIEGYMELDEAHIWIYKFFRANIAYGAEVLFGVKLFPFQVLMVKAILEADYVINVLSRGGSKTWSCAIAAMIYAILNPGIKIGVVSKSFRQARFIFSKMEDILNKPLAALGAECRTDMNKSADQWVMKFGTSEIYALPLGDGEKLRGFRFNLMIIDEFLLMPESIYNEVILPFLAVVTNPHEREEMRKLEDAMIAAGQMEEKDRHVWLNNKMVALSSASYKFDYLYKLYEKFEALILKGVVENKETGEVEALDDAQRVIIHMGIEALPPALYDQNLIKQGRATMSQAQFDREFNAVFLDDSSGYFKVSTMKACTIEPGHGQGIEIKGLAGDKYIVSVDPSWSESDTSDDFAIQVSKLNEDGSSTIVHSFALAGHPLNVYMTYFLYILEAFKPVLIIFDFMGGLVFMNACNESEMFKSKKINLKTIDIDFNDHEEYEKELEKMKREYNAVDNRICIMRTPTPKWIRQANELLQSNFDHRRMKFASGNSDDEYKLLQKMTIPIENLTFKKVFDFEKNDKGQNNSTAKMVDFLDHIPNMIQLTKDQCALIVPTSNTQGTQHFDLPSNLKRMTGPDRPRKDLYSALVLNSWGVKVWNDMHGEKIGQNAQTFTPFFV